MFFVIDIGLYPSISIADTIEYNIVTDEFYGLNAKRILLVSRLEDADQIVSVIGKCNSRAQNDLYLEEDPINASEKWYQVSTSSNIKPDLRICLSGNAPSWYQKASQPYEISKKSN